MFLSHQWLGGTTADGTPDSDDNAQYTAMCKAIWTVLTEEQEEDVLLSEEGSNPLLPTVSNPLSSIYVWCDFISIPQARIKATSTDRRVQDLAVMSLPIYSALSDVFVMVVPQALKVNGDGSTEMCNLESCVSSLTYRTFLVLSCCSLFLHLLSSFDTPVIRCYTTVLHAYADKSRGWCRAEIVARALSNPLSKAYIADETGCHQLKSLIDFALDDSSDEGAAMSVFGGKQIELKSSRTCSIEKEIHLICSGMQWENHGDRHTGQACSPAAIG